MMQDTQYMYYITKRQNFLDLSLGISKDSKKSGVAVIIIKIDKNFRSQRI